ncbi:MAG: hypothetical protein L0Y67_02495 [Gammaproteobacteria bacterium]|nr:hypothetical protein [Gammaproteobacteria bacterium]MCI0590467.1 hypothetical protein [Gammaproteobacteria bacterium]
MFNTLQLSAKGFAAALTVSWFALSVLPSPASGVNENSLPPTSDEASTLIGRIYEMGADHGQPLYIFKRTETQSGSTTNVLREYTYPDGDLASIERVAYDSGQMVSYELEELQIDAHGRAVIRRDPVDGNKEKIFFEYTKGHGPSAEKHANIEELKSDTLSNDSLVPYLFAHWDTLMSGKKVTFRYVVIPRSETVGFEFSKEGESTEKGKHVTTIKMEPSSFIISALVKPIYFTIETDGSMHVTQYTGRTTPKIRKDGVWKDLDAVTVFGK